MKRNTCTIKPSATIMQQWHMFVLLRCKILSPNLYDDDLWEYCCREWDVIVFFFFGYIYLVYRQRELMSNHVSSTTKLYIVSNFTAWDQKGDKTLDMTEHYMQQSNTCMASINTKHVCRLLSKEMESNAALRSHARKQVSSIGLLRLICFMSWFEGLGIT